MKSVRLDPGLETRLVEASRRSGESVSALIRAAIENHCNRLLEERGDHRLADVIGIIKSSGHRARTTGASYRKLLRARRDR